MKDPIQPADTGFFGVAEIDASLPELATTLLVDRYLTNRDAASSRVFRVYRSTRHGAIPKMLFL